MARFGELCTRMEFGPCRPTRSYQQNIHIRSKEKRDSFRAVILTECWPEKRHDRNTPCLSIDSPLVDNCTLKSKYLLEKSDIMDYHWKVRISKQKYMTKYTKFVSVYPAKKHIFFSNVYRLGPSKYTHGMHIRCYKCTRLNPVQWDAADQTI